MIQEMTDEPPQEVKERQMLQEVDRALIELGCRSPTKFDKLSFGTRVIQVPVQRAFWWIHRVGKLQIGLGGTKYTYITMGHVSDELRDILRVGHDEEIPANNDFRYYLRVLH